MDDIGPGHVHLESVGARRKGAITVRSPHFLNQVVQICWCVNAVAAMTCVAANAALGHDVTRTNASFVKNHINQVQIVFRKLNRGVAENGRVALQLKY